MRLWIIFLFSFFMSIDSYAENLSSKVFVLFINGVNTSQTDARLNLDKLETYSNISSNMITWDLLYNSTHGLLASDLWDTLAQKKQEGKNLSIDDYVMTYMKTYNLNYPIDSDEYKKLKEKVKVLYQEDPSFVGKNLKEISDQFHSIVKDYKNSYVFLVSHSQGNLYANQLYDYLVNAENFPRQHLALLGIASPADKILGIIDPIKPTNSSRYFTADNDYVINSLGFFSNFIPVTNIPMEGNVHLSECDDLLCHGLVSSYLTDNEIRYRISQKVSHFLLSLKSNLVKEGKNNNIRLIVEMWSDKNCHACKGEFITKSGQVICTVELRGHGKCDENIMNYLEIPQEYDSENLDSYVNHFIGFTDKLKAGDYKFLAELYDDYDLVNFQILGNIKSATSYEVDEWCTTAKLSENFYLIDSPPDGPFTGFLWAYIYVPFWHYECVNKFPYLIYNNKLLGQNISLF